MCSKSLEHMEDVTERRQQFARLRIGIKAKSDKRRELILVLEGCGFWEFGFCVVDANF